MTGVQGELKYRALRAIGCEPQLSFVSFDDGAANRQPHAHAVGLGREQRIEYLIDVCCTDSRAGVGHGNSHPIACVRRAFHAQDPRLVLAGHRLDGVHDQVDEHLL